MSLLDDIDFNSDISISDYNNDYNNNYQNDLTINLGIIENYYQEIENQNNLNKYKIYSAFLFLVLGVYYFHIQIYNQNKNIKLISYY